MTAPAHPLELLARDLQEQNNELGLPDEKLVKWFDKQLCCTSCCKGTWRPHLSERPCAWCGGDLR